MDENRTRARDAWHERINKNPERIEAAYDSQPKKKSKKPFIIIGAIIAGVVVLALFASLITSGDKNDTISVAKGVGENHIGVLYVEGTIGADASGAYNHQYELDTIDGMIMNDNNKGLLLYVNTPGGSVAESDELYLKVMEYHDSTGRPVYAYFGSQATSGGYYVSAGADKILANRNCWTGSIGVTMGTFVDISGLLEKYGIRTETIASGANKSMGSMTEPLTDEQRQILQSLIDEAYDQFVGIVADGRGLNESYVRRIADGRIYTALQAEKLKLVDDVVATYDEALEYMKADCGLEKCEAYEFRYTPDEGLLGSLVKSIDKLSESESSVSDVAAISKLIEKLQSGQELPLQYMCEVVK